MSRVNCIIFIGIGSDTRHVKYFGIYYIWTVPTGTHYICVCGPAFLNNHLFAIVCCFCIRYEWCNCMVLLYRYEWDWESSVLVAMFVSSEVLSYGLESQCESVRVHEHMDWLRNMCILWYNIVCVCVCVYACAW